MIFLLLGRLCLCVLRAGGLVQEIAHAVLPDVPPAATMALTLLAMLVRKLVPALVSFDVALPRRVMPVSLGVLVLTPRVVFCGCCSRCWRAC